MTHSGKPKPGRPIKALHVIGSLNYGGVETWLMHVLRNLDRSEVALDFVTTKAEPGAHAPEAESLGCRITPCPIRPGLRSYGRRLEQLLRTGAYDIVHSHVYFFSGYVLKIAARAGVPVRIAHIHRTMDDKRQTFVRRVYRNLMLKWINRYGNCFIATSQAAMNSLWGEAARSDGRHHVLYCGIDLNPLFAARAKGACRRELGLPLDRPIVVNVGRFTPYKNQIALLPIAARVLLEVPDACFVFAGDGPMLKDVQQQISQAGLHNSFHFLGGVKDLVPLWNAADLFIFPTLMEGFGLVIVEAAASGLPVVASDISGVREAAQACSEATLIEPHNAAEFARVTVRYLKQRKRYPPIPSRLCPFSINASIQNLFGLYSQLTAKADWLNAG